MLLQLRGRMSAEALAAEFEVCVRTIYRDIDQLSASGVPVYAERGRSGGFALLEGYRARLNGFTTAEADALLLAGAGPAAEGLGIGAEAAAARLKLLSGLPPEAGERAERVSARFHLDPAPWYARHETPAVMPQIAEAVWRERRIRMGYDSWAGGVERIADPLGVVLKAGVWYLVAAVRGAPRTYRASNITSLEVLDSPARRPAGFNLERHWTAWTEDFERRLASQPARIRVSRAGRRLMRDFWASAFAALPQPGLSEAGPDWIEARIDVEEAAQSVRQFLRLGSEVEVLAPADLRRAVAREAQQIASLYRGGRPGGIRSSPR
jgi:predicted DNA-binding transcriptional regulator YafY